jgi:purine-nucleoside phosphorylase
MGDIESSMEDVSHDEVLKAAAKAEPHVRKLIKELILQY